jgi:hypothetical protein
MLLVFPKLKQAFGFEVAKAEVATWVEPSDGLSISSAEVNTWTEPPTGFTVSKTDVVAWTEPPGGATYSKATVDVWLDVATAPDPTVLKESTAILIYDQDEADSGNAQGWYIIIRRRRKYGYLTNI